MLQPATGELTYTTPEGTTRLLQFPAFGEGARAFDLPLESVIGHGVLVDLHPSRRGHDLISGLHGAWGKSRIHMLRAVGGSPTLALAEAARGRFIYVNSWSGHAASPYDLAAGALLIHGAGGRVINTRGHDIDPLRHQGPLIAGVDPDALERVRSVIESGAPSSG
ncbi:MAG: hypothetical protein AAGM22_20750 [Acidobacteriota bacterium]